MTDPEADFLAACETHSPDGMRRALDDGVDARSSLRGKLPIEWLIEMYTRSDRFGQCLRLLFDRGARLADPVIAPVLLDDAAALRTAIRADASLLTHRTTLNVAFTPLVGASLLHVAAEFGHLHCLGVLIDTGADVDAQAEIDEHGLGGQTALFHTVNSAGNRSLPAMLMLLAAGARPDVSIAGICWGRGFAWETTLFDLTAISYAQFGLLPQMHRDERDIRDNVEALLRAAARPVPSLVNVPNRYLLS